MSSRDPARISPTAHYTGRVWYKNGLGHPALRTHLGAAFYLALAPADVVQARVLRASSLQGLLLRRHAVIDHLLDRAVADEGVTQVLEVAAGLSPRGLRMRRRHPGLRYVEADLPEMARNKQRMLSEAGLGDVEHRVAPVNAMLDDGPLSLAAVAAAHLDPARPTAIITEGLLNYLDRRTCEAVWARFARLLSGFPGGLYLSDLHVADETFRHLGAKAFAWLLDRFTGSVHMDFRDVFDARAALVSAGFADARLHTPADFEDALNLPRLRGPDLVRIVEARP